MTESVVTQYHRCPRLWMARERAINFVVGPLERSSLNPWMTEGFSRILSKRSTRLYSYFPIFLFHTKTETVPGSEKLGGFSPSRGLMSKISVTTMATYLVLP